ncbi:branched-chain amino acid ABC transporter permease [Ferviditalea candida]|uniref:Branched-chain amino acid ABC transporter permease n=1 Tax=Ferviditalea candida TaxID=3108399 RepID=A0ABU5ZPQ1_9BACL|nr:branched-chain amino acid ABC transporter permease [Paenibacillaceae bacterium T2]
MDFGQLMQFVITGLTIGSIYGLIAIGFVAVYNVTGVLNFAHGEFAMVGALTSISLIHAGLPLFLSIPLAIAITAFLGGMIEKTTLSPVRNASVVTLIIITLGLSIIIRGLGYILWGAYPLSMDPFSNNEPIHIWGAVLIPQSMWVFATMIVLLGGLYVFFEKTVFGAALKACVVNRKAAELMGINTKSLSTFSFIMSAAIGAVAGIVITPITSATYDMGLFLGLKGVVAMVLGGMNSLTGAVLGGLVLGLLETFAGGYVSTAYSDAISFAILILLLFFAPNGLLAKASGKRV